MAMLEVKDLQVYYVVIQALKGISFPSNTMLPDFGERIPVSV